MSIIKFVYPLTKIDNNHSKKRDATAARTWLREYVRHRNRKGARSYLRKQLNSIELTDNCYRKFLLALFEPQSVLHYMEGVQKQMEEILERAHPGCVEVRFDSSGGFTTDMIVITIWHKDLVITDVNNNEYISKDVFAIINVMFDVYSNRIVLAPSVKKMSWTPRERKMGFISPHVNGTSTNTANDFCWGNEAPEGRIYTSTYNTAPLIAMKILLYVKQFQALLKTEYTNSSTGHRPHISLGQITSTLRETQPREVFEKYLLPFYKENHEKLHHDFTIALQDLGYPYIKSKLNKKTLDYLTANQSTYYTDNGKYYTTSNVTAPKSVVLYKEEFYFKGQKIEPQLLPTVATIALETKALPPADILLLEKFVSTYFTKIFYEKYKSGQGTKFPTEISVVISRKSATEITSEIDSAISDTTDDASNMGTDYQSCVTTEDQLLTSES